MPAFIYRAGMVTGRDPDERRAYLKAFGGNLKIERVKRGLRQGEFADLIGLRRTFCGQLERGQRGINLAELPSIARGARSPPGRPAARASGMKADRFAARR
jgi:transcriptional regulator with XRE-family HTH domain